MGGYLFLRELFSFFEIKTWQSKDLQSVFQICPREVAGGRRKKKKTEAKQHFLFERKQEKAGGERFGSLLPWNNKNLTWTGNGSASKRA